MNPEQALQFLSEVAMRNCGNEPLHRQFYQQAAQALAEVVQQFKAAQETAKPKPKGEKENGKK